MTASFQKCIAKIPKCTTMAKKTTHNKDKIVQRYAASATTNHQALAFHVENVVPSGIQTKTQHLSLYTTTLNKYHYIPSHQIKKAL